MANDKYPTKVTAAIGLRLREARKNKFRKSYIFARIMQVEPATVTNWEKGRVAFTADSLYELAKFLDVSPAWLLTGEGEMERRKGNKEIN